MEFDRHYRNRSRSRDRVDRPRDRDRRENRSRSRDRLDDNDRNRYQGRDRYPQNKDRNRDIHKHKSEDYEKGKDRDYSHRHDNGRRNEKNSDNLKKFDDRGRNDNNFDKGREGRLSERLEKDGLYNRERNSEGFDREGRKRKASKSRSPSVSRDGRKQRDRMQTNNQQDAVTDSSISKTAVEPPTSATTKAPTGNGPLLSVNVKPIVNVFSSNDRAALKSKQRLLNNTVVKTADLDDGKENDSIPNEAENDEEVVDLDTLLGGKKETEEEEALRLAAERRQRLLMISSKYQQKDAAAVAPARSEDVGKAKDLKQEGKEKGEREGEGEGKMPVKPEDRSLNSDIGSVESEASQSDKTVTTAATRSQTQLSSSISLENLSIIEDAPAKAHPYNSLILSIAKQQERKEESDPAKAATMRFEEAAGDERAQLEAEKTALEEEEKQMNGGKKFVFDIFSASPSELEQMKQLRAPLTGGGGGGGGRALGPSAGPVNTLAGGRRATREALLEGESPHLQSNWDDGEGYYKARVGEIIGDRFQTLGILGSLLHNNLT